jgi:hypothetical protein
MRITLSYCRDSFRDELVVFGLGGGSRTNDCRRTLSQGIGEDCGELPIPIRPDFSSASLHSVSLEKKGSLRTLDWKEE